MRLTKGENAAILKAVKEIETLYEEATAGRFDGAEETRKRFDELTRTLPDRIWIE